MSTALEWFKSSYSGDEGGACLEVAYTWRKSTIHVRDSKNPNPEAGPTLTTTRQAWTAFTAYAAR
ncbi:DUF397 domain-containing protein [Streptomyces graminilatus]|uniref:DUF397 domain-containing protein n=1 Tax=Streptomyces graminilatus TaxID=1464070 RepID=UPI0006E165BC|nr:DUF397 domain-containing protein [Streptomyces graminilatus]